MANELLVALVALLGGALPGAATLAGAYSMRGALSAVEGRNVLTDAQKVEVFQLARASQSRRLAPIEEARLRALVAHELPFVASALYEELEYNALYMVGVWFTGSLPVKA